MKNQIDKLVCGILYDLTQPEPTPPELAVALASIGADGFNKALQQRDVLISFAEDVLLPFDDRQYAQQQLKALPVF